ncbi:MAG: hypothetical protein IPI67_06995 [Myxococcales bacterium]|nr:hypothetical protein [Myxococcales bacterium]
MRRRRFLLRAALTALPALLVTACPTTEPQSPRTVSGEAGVAPTHTASEHPSELDASGSPDADPSDAGLSKLPAAFAKLGGSCSVSDAGGSSVELCDASGQVVGISAMVDTVDGVPPAGAEVIRVEPEREMNPGRSLVVALEQDRLWFRLVSCGACRRIMGWSFVGELARLSDAQLRDIQQRLGLPLNVPALRTSQAWRDVYRDRPLPAVPDGSAPHAKPLSAPPGVPGECMNPPPHVPTPVKCKNLK